MHVVAALELMITLQAVHQQMKFDWFKQEHWKWRFQQLNVNDNWADKLQPLMKIMRYDQKLFKGVTKETLSLDCFVNTLHLIGAE